MAKPQRQETEEFEQGQSEAEPSTSARPAITIRGSGGLQVAVWKHKTDEGRDRYSIRTERSYRDNDGNYQSTQYLRDGDLLRLGKLLEQADQWIEQEKANYRASAAGQSQSR